MQHEKSSSIHITVKLHVITIIYATYNYNYSDLYILKLKGRGRGPPESKMDMAMRMTGAERRQYVEWKTERDKIDEARINRQKTQQGEWRREWDHDKVPQE